MKYLLYTDDHCRVVLTQQGQKPGSDYVNASFVDVSDLDYFTDYSDVFLILSMLRVIKSQRLTLQHRVQSVTRWIISGG